MNNSKRILLTLVALFLIGLCGTVFATARRSIVRHVGCRLVRLDFVMRLQEGDQVDQLRDRHLVVVKLHLGFPVRLRLFISVPEGKNLPDYAKELREEADRVGIDIVNYTIGADFLKGSNGDVKAEIERVKIVEKYLWII